MADAAQAFEVLDVSDIFKSIDRLHDDAFRGGPGHTITIQHTQRMAGAMRGQISQTSDKSSTFTFATMRRALFAAISMRVYRCTSDLWLIQQSGGPIGGSLTKMR